MLLRLLGARDDPRNASGRETHRLLLEEHRVLEGRKAEHLGAKGWGEILSCDEHALSQDDIEGRGEGTRDRGPFPHERRWPRPGRIVLGDRREPDAEHSPSTERLACDEARGIRSDPGHPGQIRPLMGDWCERVVEELGVAAVPGCALEWQGDEVAETTARGRWPRTC